MVSTVTEVIPMIVEYLYEYDPEDVDDTDWPYEWLKDFSKGSTILSAATLGLWDGDRYVGGVFNEESYLGRFKGGFDIVVRVTDPREMSFEFDLTDEKCMIPYKKGDIIYYHHHHDGINQFVFREDTKPCKRYTPERFIKHFMDAKVVTI